MTIDTCNGHVVDLLICFAQADGFVHMLSRLGIAGFASHHHHMLLMPFVDPCQLGMLNATCITQFLLPICESAQNFLSTLSGPALQSESKELASFESLGPLMQVAKSVSAHVKAPAVVGETWDRLMLDVLLKLLKCGSFYGVMYMLKELKKQW